MVLVVNSGNDYMITDAPSLNINDIIEKLRFVTSNATVSLETWKIGTELTVDQTYTVLYVDEATDDNEEFGTCFITNRIWLADGVVINE